MADYVVVKRIRSADSKHELEIYRREDGFFGYFGHSELTDNGYTFWAATEFSGIYDSLESAQRAVLADVAWLRAEDLS
jgi:hypothetical protein